MVEHAARTMTESRHRHMGTEDGATVTVDKIYDLLIEVRDDVREMAPLPNIVRDHESRLREVESHGSRNSQEVEKEMLRIRERLHNVEGTQSFQTAIVTENSDSLKATRTALVRLAFLAVGAVLTALGTLLIALLLGL